MEVRVKKTNKKRHKKNRGWERSKNKQGQKITRKANFRFKKGWNARLKGTKG